MYILPVEKCKVHINDVNLLGDVRLISFSLKASSHPYIDCLYIFI